MSEEEVKERIEECGNLDILVLKAALEKANETIRELHGELHKNKQGNEEDIEKVPVVDMPEIEAKTSQSKTKMDSANASPEHRTVNVRMLDGENFVTDWDELRPSLPPPPDHGLRSPIVMAVLEQWTNDRSLHDSLLAWMEHVMMSDNLDDLPPLTISSLDHQVRDGFTMHVLPLLLRRADIHVGVQTRAHRQTTYDMAVNVSQKSNLMIGLDAIYQSQSQQDPQHPSLLDRQDSTRSGDDEWVNRFEPKLGYADSMANSAVTEPIANLAPASMSPPPQTPRRSPHRSPQPSPMGYSSFATQLRNRTSSGDTMDDGSHYRQQQQTPPSGIMGALGGALSGLLSRSKYAASPGRASSSSARHHHHSSSFNDHESANMPASLRAQLDLTSSPVPGHSGYHRSAGKNGNGNEMPASLNQNNGANLSADEQQPYHRVVSAPPGRIGVTFVEFRGHAMVSDVAMDSPLSGWVFPSDVLIAVDEIPVSGMRVRDIVKILSNRKDRQRALRVISSHAMNEFTVGQGALHEGDEED